MSRNATDQKARTEPVAMAGIPSYGG
jgi:hypothetical protein